MSTSPPPIEDATRDFLKALASETRQQIMQVFAGGLDLTVGEVAQRAGLGVSTASEHLALMRRGGLVVSRRDGKTVRYRVDAGQVAERLDAVKRYLACCCPPEDQGAVPPSETTAGR